MSVLHEATTCKSGPAPFWLKPFSIFGFFGITVFKRQFTYVHHSSLSLASAPPDAGSDGEFLAVLSALDKIEADYIVP